MFNPFSYFYAAPPEEKKEEIKPEIEDAPKFKYSHVDAHLLIWDIHHLSYHELEDKYRAKYLTLCTLLKAAGFPIFQTERTDIETTLVTIPQELTFLRHNSI
jgi:hypothetical protein